MFATWLITVALLLALIGGWLRVQAAARRVADRHPEFGKFRELRAGCGGDKCDGHGGCGSEKCEHD